MLVIVSGDAATAESLRTAVGKPAEVVASVDAARRYLNEHHGVDVVLVGPLIDSEPALELARAMRVARPQLGVILVRRRVDTAILGDALRAGIREVVPERDLSAVATAVARALDVAHEMRVQSEQVPDSEDTGHEGHVVTVFSAKGGCGKTTLATNLAAALAAGGRREVCLVDLDLAFGDVAIALQLFPAHTIADAVAMGDTLDEARCTRSSRRTPPGSPRWSPRWSRVRRSIPVDRVAGCAAAAQAAVRSTSSSTPRRRSPTTCWRPSTRATSSRCSRRWTSRR